MYTTLLMHTRETTMVLMSTPSLTAKCDIIEQLQVVEFHARKRKCRTHEQRESFEVKVRERLNRNLPESDCRASTQKLVHGSPFVHTASPYSRYAVARSAMVYFASSAMGASEYPLYKHLSSSLLIYSGL